MSSFSLCDRSGQALTDRWHWYMTWPRHSASSKQADGGHELTNSVGDITPVEGVPAHVKHQLEQEAMDAFLNEMLGGPGNKDARERFRSLWDVCVLHTMRGSSC